MCISLICV